MSYEYGYAPVNNSGQVDLVEYEEEEEEAGGEEAPPAGEETPPSGEEETPPEDGKGEGEEKPPAEGEEKPPKVDRLAEFAAKKGWKEEDGKSFQDTLLDSYTNLESKLGGLSAIEKEAELWRAAQKYLDEIDNAGPDGKPDLSKMSVQELSTLWKDGKIGLADVPKSMQYQVQQHLNTTQQNTVQANRDQAAEMIKNNPVLENPDALEFVATKIESGIKPDDAIAQVKKLMSAGENKADERNKADTQAIKDGNLETTGTPVKTKPVEKIGSVRDALLAAKKELKLKDLNNLT